MSSLDEYKEAADGLQTKAEQQDWKVTPQGSILH